MIRRKFIKFSSAFALVSPFKAFLTTEKRKFTMCLNPGAIGMKSDINATVEFAQRYGFESIAASTSELAELSPSELDKVVATMSRYGISWGAGGLPIQFRENIVRFKADLYALPRHAEVAAKVGLKGLTTWIMPTHDHLTYHENFELHRDRLKEVARILQRYDLRLGLEYVGPRTLMARDQFPFIGSMRETKELINAIGENNVGMVLDSFHWFCAGENVIDILTLHPRDIVTVDLNDAKAGRTYKEQLDNERELPGKTGIIDLDAFLGSLVQIGYDGPVRAEPFNNALNAMDDEAAVKLTAEAMKKSLHKFD